MHPFLRVLLLALHAQCSVSPRTDTEVITQTSVAVDPGGTLVNTIVNTLALLGTLVAADVEHEGTAVQVQTISRIDTATLRDIDTISRIAEIADIAR